MSKVAGQWVRRVNYDNRDCARCGATFTPNNVRQKYCSSNCHDSRSNRGIRKVSPPGMRVCAASDCSIAAPLSEWPHRRAKGKLYPEPRCADCRRRDRRERRRRDPTECRLNYSRRKNAPSIHFTQDQLTQRLSVWGFKCWMCGVDWQCLDHVKPIVSGGWHCLSNIRPACRSCNSRKRDTWPYVLAS